jgi:hypothetical protein
LPCCSPISCLQQLTYSALLTFAAIHVGGRNQNNYPVIKPKLFFSVYYRNSEREALSTAAFFSTDMKKFIVFILVLSLLIAAEYYFLTEFLTQKRIPVIAGTLLVIVGSLFYLTRFFKQTYISS